MKIPRVSRKTVRIEMLPLIDIVFLLLVFFIYAMLSMAVHSGIPLKLPVSSTAQTIKKQTLSVSVDAQGQVFVNQALIPLENLTEALQRHPPADPEAGVLLFADRQVNYQQLYQVLDHIRKAGIERISLQAEAETDTSP